MKDKDDQKPQETGRPQPRRDPAPFSPPPDVAQFLSTNSVPSVENPGALIPTIIVAEMTLIKRMTITSPQLLALSSTPVTVLSAPGEGLLWLVRSVMMATIPGSGSYSVGGAPNLFYGDPGNDIRLIIDPSYSYTDLTGMVSGNFERIYINANLNLGGPRDAAEVVNQPINFGMNGGSISGYGTLSLGLALEYSLLQI